VKKHQKRPKMVKNWKMKKPKKKSKIEKWKKSKISVSPEKKSRAGLVKRSIEANLQAKHKKKASRFPDKFAKIFHFLRQNRPKTAIFWGQKSGHLFPYWLFGSKVGKKNLLHPKCRLFLKRKSSEHFSKNPSTFLSTFFDHRVSHKIPVSTFSMYEKSAQKWPFLSALKAGSGLFIVFFDAKKTDTLIKFGPDTPTPPGEKLIKSHIFWKSDRKPGSPFFRCHFLKNIKKVTFFMSCILSKVKKRATKPIRKVPIL
jgi:hypothetical protein